MDTSSGQLAVAFLVVAVMVFIALAVWYQRRKGLVRVEIGPVTRETRPLVQSLQVKIDEAFALRGLA